MSDFTIQFKFGDPPIPLPRWNRTPWNDFNNLKFVNVFAF